MVSIIVVDDQKIIREGIKSLLANQTEIKIVADASNGKDALAKIEQLQPDVVLLDIDMPGVNGFTMISQLKKRFPAIEIIIVSSHEQENYIRKATELGAKGYLLKNASSQELEWSIKLVNHGYSAIKSDLSNKQLTQSVSLRSKQKQESDSDTGLEGISSSTALLSDRDRANLAELELLLAKNKARKQYSSYKKQRQKANSWFHSVSLSQVKKTMTSMEFKILVLAIMFCLGFLIFVALS